MKKLLIIAALTVSIFLILDKTTVSALPAYYRQESSEKLVLNNGAKWKVDQPTNINVKNLKALVAGFNNGKDRSLNGYRKIATDLQSGLDKMIRECRMKGPNHLALHKWLEPLMGDVSKLKQASTAASASGSFEAIKLQLNRYDQYFVL
jgi:hypothetical protein